MATITLGLPQPTALTALPLPDEDETDLNATAIELDKDSDSLIECPLCFHLINSQESRCPIYKEYTKKDVSATDSAILFDYQSIAQKARSYFYLGLASALLFGLGLFLGPWVIWKGLRVRPLLCANLEAENRKMLDAGIFMSGVGIISSTFFLTSVFF